MSAGYRCVFPVLTTADGLTVKLMELVPKPPPRTIQRICYFRIELFQEPQVDQPTVIYRQYELDRFDGGEMAFYREVRVK